MSVRVRIGALVLALAFFGLSILTLGRADSARATTEQDYMYLPNRTILSHFTVGMNSIIANLLWLECIQYTGRSLMTDQEYEWMEQMVRTAAELDPHFVGLYHYGGIFLASLKGDGDAAIDLLEMGVRNNPDSWRLPYEIAMVHLLNRSYDPKSKCNALRYVAMSLATGKAPEFMQPFYEGLQDQCAAQDNDPCADLAFEAQTFQRLYETGEKMIQDMALHRLEMIQLRQYCCDLNRIAGHYAQTRGEMPRSIDDLLSAGMIEVLPEDPFGGEFFIDADGVVKNTTVQDELLDRQKTRLERVIERYQARHNEYPPSLESLLESRTISSLPPYPYASRDWQYDPATGVVE